MSAPALEFLYPDVRNKCHRAIGRVERMHNVRIVPHIGVRTILAQVRLYGRGRTIPGPNVSEKKPLGDIVTNLLFGLHNVGLALDIHFGGKDPYLDHDERRDTLWEAWGMAVEAEGLVWGGRWKNPVDMPHAQLTYGLKTDEMRALFNEKGIRGVWTELDRIRGVEPVIEWSDTVRSLENMGMGRPSTPI